MGSQYRWYACAEPDANKYFYTQSYEYGYFYQYPDLDTYPHPNTRTLQQSILWLVRQRSQEEPVLTGSGPQRRAQHPAGGLSVRDRLGTTQTLAAPNCLDSSLSLARGKLMDHLPRAGSSFFDAAVDRARAALRDAGSTPHVSRVTSGG